jgi:DNA-directed RNA polymerase subunit RPC12/RpoP
MLGTVNVLTCPACRHQWTTLATGTTSRCGECGHTTYVPIGLRRVPAPAYLVSCGQCGHSWWSTAASGRTECRGCGARVYVPVSGRGLVTSARRHAPPAPRPVVRPVAPAAPRPVPSPPPRAVPPDPLSTLVDALLAGATRQAVPAAPARSPSPVRRGAPAPPRTVSAPAMSGQADPRIVPVMRCPTCGTGIARCGLALCPMPDGP